MKTLSTIFEKHYLPLRLADATTDSVELYRLILRRWAAVTGDPDVAAITSELLAEFTAQLRASPGIKRHGRPSPGGKMSVNTVRGYLRAVQTLLDFCGPKTRQCRDGLGILQVSPWVRPPPGSVSSPRIIPLERLSECYKAARVMKFPRVARIKPPDWWRCLLAAAYNLGLRRGTLLAVEQCDIHWDEDLLKIPPERMKSAREHVLPLNRTAAEHLTRVSNGPGRLFRWPLRTEALLNHLYRLEDAVGIPVEERFGLHDIRRTASTNVAEVSSPEVARVFLAHVPLDTAMTHYINAQKMLARAVEAMPQPAAFVNGKH